MYFLENHSRDKTPVIGICVSLERTARTACDLKRHHQDSCHSVEPSFEAGEFPCQPSMLLSEFLAYPFIEGALCLIVWIVVKRSHKEVLLSSLHRFTLPEKVALYAPID